VGVEWLELRGELGYTAFRSVQGLDRTEESLTDDVALAEAARDVGASAWFSPPELPLKLGVSWERRQRTSTVLGSGADAGDTRRHGERWLMNVEFNP
jgi:hypothetical protein